MEPNWANLEALPLSFILDKLEERIDHVWFGAVCKNWQVIAKLNHQSHQFKINMLPMLMIPTKTLCLESNSITKKHGLYGIPHKRWYPFQFQSHHTNPTILLCGSSHGWLALFDDSSFIITLMNPFKDLPHIILPPLNRVSKVTLSADPIKSPNDYVVVAIYCNSGDLAFIRKGEKNWTYIEISKPFLMDVIFYKGLLFAINIQCKIASVNICCSNDLWDEKKITPNIILQENVNEGILQDKFLVRSLNEELWMVRRCSPYTNTFDVYKLKLDDKSEKLEEMYKLKSLGDNILFLSNGDSISVSASYFSKSLRRDSIYFANGLEVYDIKSNMSRYLNMYEKCYFWILPYFQWG